jgi:hypothetical protein
MIISAAALSAAGGCAKKAEEVIVVPQCDCEEPCAECVCEEEVKARAGEAAPVEKSGL